MALTFNLPSQIVVQTAAQWAADNTVYSNKRILVTSDAYYGSTDQRKFKIADGVQTWSNLDYVPISQTLAEVLANGNSNGGYLIKSPNNYSQLRAYDTYNALRWDSATTYGQVVVNDAKIEAEHDVQIDLNAPTINIPQSTASRIVETDASKNLTYAAKNTAYNKNFGTGSGEVTQGNDTRIVKSSFDISFDGQGGVITINANALKVALANGGTVTGFSIKSDIVGSIEIDMKKNGVSMVGAGNKIDLVSQSSDTGSPTSWTSTTFVADDEIEFVVSSATTITKLWLTIKYDKTS